MSDVDIELLAVCNLRRRLFSPAATRAPESSSQ